MKIVDEGIFIHRFPYSESSAIVSYFTKNHGFQKFMFLGVRKKKIQLFAMNLQQLTFYKRPDSELGKLTNADSAGLIHEIPFHPLRSSLAYFCAEICQKCLHHTEKDLDLYEFLENAAVMLDSAEDLSAFPHWFLLKLAEHLGIQPQIISNEPKSFQLLEGIFTDQFLIDNSIQGEPMRFLYALLQNQKINVSRKARKEALWALLKYYRLHVESFSELRTIRVVEEIFE